MAWRVCATAGVWRLQPDFDPGELSSKTSHLGVEREFALHPVAGVAQRGVQLRPDGREAQGRNRNRDRVIIAAEVAKGKARRRNARGVLVDVIGQAGFADLGELAQHPRDRRLRDAEPRGDIDLTRLAALADQVADQLDIVLDKLAAARLLKVGKSTLYRKLKRFDLK